MDKDTVTTSLSKILANQELLYRQNRELIYAEIFHDTIKGSEWFPQDFPVSPGNYAIGYPALYVLYRVLNEFKPSNILEMGLGQSTKMIGLYNQKYKACRHQVVEHNKEWIDFFSNSFKMPETTQIVELPITDIVLDVGEGPVKVTSYIGFSECFEGQKFDFIFIDGPYGFNSTTYSRIDIMGILPECLKDSFVIMLDDCDREGEYNTLKLISETLFQNNIPNRKMVYHGEKGIGIVASEDLTYLCTM